MLEQVAEGIHKLIVRFPGGMGEVNCYLLEGEHGYTVIDTGVDSKEARTIWKQALATGLKLEKVVLTHTHQDHIGLAKWFQQQIGVPVIVSDLGHQEMQYFCETDADGRLVQLVDKHGGPVLRNRRDHSLIYDFKPDGIYQNHDTIQLGNDIYEAIWTPGHAPDHFCFYQQDRQIMLVGDHILQNVSPVIGLWEGREENPLKDYYDSLDLMANYPAALALPGHGEPIKRVKERVNEIRSRHDHRLEQVLQILKTGQCKTAQQVCDEVYGTIAPGLKLSSFMAILTRLIYLESIGEIKRTEHGGKVAFHVNAVKKNTWQAC
ncbi:MBL fold metallo-hydrolase [Lentibacillus sp. N15]|uniref:MBL fold metallo-hydrolase n=1 Tax=Lentibacillus songyuanensis TaxID=3136161 RepID=UPI0031B9EA2C